MARQRGRFMRDAFLQITIRGDDPGAVIHQRNAKTRRHHAFCHGHADRGGNALAERAGGGFNPRMFAEFRMAGGGGMELAEALEVFSAHALMPCQMKQGVKQHGPMAGGKDKAVPIRPARVGGVVLQKTGKKRSRSIGHAHRHAGMAGFGLLNRINRQRANGIGHAAGIIKRAGKNGRLGGERGVGRVGGGDGGHVWGNLNGCVFSLGAIGRGATSGNRGGGRRATCQWAFHFTARPPSAAPPRRAKAHPAGYPPKAHAKSRARGPGAPPRPPPRPAKSAA